MKVITEELAKQNFIISKLADHDSISIFSPVFSCILFDSYESYICHIDTIIEDSPDLEPSIIEDIERAIAKV